MNNPQSNWLDSPRISLFCVFAGYEVALEIACEVDMRYMKYASLYWDLYALGGVIGTLCGHCQFPEFFIRVKLIWGHPRLRYF